MSILDQCNRDPNCTPDIYTYTNAIRCVHVMDILFAASAMKIADPD